MMQEKILEKLQSIIVPYLENPCEIRMESDLQKHLTINSFNFVIIITEIEDAFQIWIDDENISKIHTINDLVKCIMEASHADK